MIESSVKSFMRGVGIDLYKRDDRLTALYIGLMLEEMSEGIHAVFDGHKTNALSSAFKEGLHDDSVASMPKEKRAELLDACVDLAWVALGCAYAMGADVEGAIAEVAKANMSKLVGCPECEGHGVVPIDGHMVKGCENCKHTGNVALRDGNGKIKKPDGWMAPDVSVYLED